MSSTKEKIAVMQAYVDGEKIQTRYNVKEEWVDVPNPQWAWTVAEYRVKPELLECWANTRKDAKNPALFHAKVDAVEHAMSIPMEWERVGVHLREVEDE